MKTTLLLFLVAGFTLASNSCKDDPPAPMVTCPVVEYKDGLYWQTITYSNITCESCKAKSRSYTEHDTEFNIDYDIRDSSWCE